MYFGVTPKYIMYCMKYLKLFSSETEYTTYKNSEDYITPNISIVKGKKQIYFNKKAKPLFPCYLQTTYSTRYDVDRLIRIHEYTVQLESSQLYDTLFNKLVWFNEWDHYVPSEFLNENPIYIDGHRVSSVNDEFKPVNQEYGIPLWVSTTDDYPNSVYYDYEPGGIYDMTVFLRPNSLTYTYELWELPDPLCYTMENFNRMLTSYLSEVYNYYLFSGETLYFNEHYNENIYINGNKIYSCSRKERLDTMYMEFTHSDDTKYLYLFNGWESGSLIQDIKFPLQLTSVEGTGTTRHILPSDLTRNLLNYLNAFCIRSGDNYLHYEFTFMVGGCCDFIEIDGIPVRNPIGYYEDYSLKHINISDGGNSGATLYLDGSIIFYIPTN